MQQIFIIIGYILLSFAVGISLPTLIESISMFEGLLTGAVLALAAGLVHEGMERRLTARLQSRHLLLLKKAYDKTKLDMLEVRNDMLHLRDMILAQEKDTPANAPTSPSAKKSQAAKAKKPKQKSKNLPSFLTDDIDNSPADAPDTEEDKDAEALAAGILSNFSGGSDTEEDYSEDYDGDDEEWDDEEDDEDFPQETEAERRQAMASEVEVLQALVDKLYTEGLPEQVRSRVEEIDHGKAELVPGIKPHVELNEALLPIVREALESKRLDAHLQPIHTLPQRKRRFFEAFGRLRSKDGELLIPERIQPLMDEDDLNPTVDTLLLYRCAQILKQNGGLEFDRAIFCNVSPSTLSDVSFLRDFSEYMEKRRTLARSLVLELDYSTVDPLLDDLREPMGRLAGIGLRFALDNVKTDDLDTLILSRSHISFVKVDSPALLALINRNGANRFEKTFSSLENADIQIIGENIASERMLMEVMDLGIEYGQGMLFGEPKPVKDPSSGLRII